MSKKRSINCYTKKGRKGLHDNQQTNLKLLSKVMQAPSFGRSAEFMDNRISLFSTQLGKCAITGIEFQVVEEIHCHHKTPRSKGGTDEYDNLILVLENIHRLIHAVEAEVISKYLELYKLDKKQLEKLNKYRLMAGREAITTSNY